MWHNQCKQMGRDFRREPYYHTGDLQTSGALRQPQRSGIAYNWAPKQALPGKWEIAPKGKPVYRIRHAMQGLRALQRKPQQFWGNICTGLFVYTAVVLLSTNLSIGIGMYL
jgi:hypothetical protein